MSKNSLSDKEKRSIIKIYKLMIYQKVRDIESLKDKIKKLRE